MSKVAKITSLRTVKFIAANGKLFCQKSVFSLLLKHDANLHAKTCQGKTALHEAARGGPGHLAIVQLLCKTGADLGAEWPAGCTVLHHAAASGEVNVVEFLLQTGAMTVNDCSQYFKNPLHKAVRGGHEDVVRLLLENGADVEARPRYGIFTPLHLAATKDHLAVAELLINSGADIHAPDKYGKYVLHNATIKWQRQTGKATLKERG